jgi:hypothetical protein
MPSVGDMRRARNHRELLANGAGMGAARLRGMPHHAQDEFPTLSDADLVATTGGMLGQLMGPISQMVGQFGGPQAQEVMGKVAPMIQSLGSMIPGMGG